MLYVVCTFIAIGVISFIFLPPHVPEKNKELKKEKKKEIKVEKRDSVYALMKDMIEDD